MRSGLREEDVMLWFKPDFVEIRMDSEVSAYIYVLE
jgi:hypothetical protein